MKSITCCFVGHRTLPRNKIERIVKRLDREIDNLISQGVTDFITGGEPGFDQIAASLIVAKREMGRDVRLLFALSCIGQDAQWPARQRTLFRSLLNEADEIAYVSKEYYSGCEDKRNRYMLDQSGYCICAFLDSRGETEQIIQYSMEQGLQVINTAI